VGFVKYVIGVLTMIKIKETKKTKLLFVCAANLNRSVACARECLEFLPHDEYEIRSAGCFYGYPYQVSEELLRWADRIYVMDLEQDRFIREKYLDISITVKIKMIGISDQYDVDSPQLQDLIRYWLKHHFKP
jgi:predicted protein tyrosine phosphatase